MYREVPYGIAGGGVWEQFPFANMHEWNMDWILRKLKTLEGRMALLDERMNSLEADMTELQQKMQQLREAMAALILKVEALEAGLESAVNRIAELEAGLESAVNRIATLEADLESAVNRIATLEADLESAMNRITALEAGLNELTGRVDALETAVSQINSAIEAQDGRISTVENTLMATVVSEKFTQNGAVGLMGRQVYMIGNVVQGTLRFRDGWTGEQDSLIVDVADLSLPGYGEYQTYCFPDRASDEPAEKVYVGWIGHHIEPTRGIGKNENLSSKPENIVEAKKTKAGGYIWNIPDVKEYLIANPAGSVVLTFKYVPIDKEA